MAPEIVYLKDPADFVKAFKEKDLSDDILRMRNYFDYAGGVCIPKEIFFNEIEHLSDDICGLLGRLGNIKDERVHMRSKEYYLHLAFGDDVKTIKSRILENMAGISEKINSLSSAHISRLETRLLLSSILDLKKHYSMCILNSFFAHMLNESMDIKVYMSAEDACIKDISNFYNFLLTGKFIGQGNHDKAVFDLFRYAHIGPRPSSISADNPLGGSSTKKLIMREMDHPHQIVLFAGNLLNEDREEKIDFIVNPLSGALEIGYALKAIYKILDIDKVQDILLVKYSRYDEGDRIRSSLSPFIPFQLNDRLNKILNKRILIIDDNTFLGDTLYDLREMCFAYTPNVGIAAIERRTDSNEKQKIGFNDLEIKPVSKLRYITRVIDFLKQNNLYGIK